MTNKEYKPLTTGGYANSKMLSQYRDRLCYLEDCIENGTLVFLPCKVGDTFWLVGKPNWDEVGEIGDTGIYERKVAEIWIWEHSVNLIDQYGGDFPIEMVYFSKEAAEKALEELEK